ncbi:MULTISPECIES: hypothetical protein [unclassified Bradyrhizobium]|uniref:hypothetical protein n=1 Tax=unclassified Bradyrhizobium TaxID=2631580 RepID=UPI0028EBB43F|nr:MULTISPECIES: hypothetical protein [unclassified Bradyrhizobium]
MTDETQQTLQQPPGGGSWVRQADGSLVPNIPPADDAGPTGGDAPKGKPEKKGK